MVAEVSINTEIPPQKIGVLSCSNKVLCWEEGWTAKFLKKSDELHEQVLLQRKVFLVECVTRGSFKGCRLALQ